MVFGFKYSSLKRKKSAYLSMMLPNIGLIIREIIWMRAKVMPMPDPGIPSCFMITDMKGKTGELPRDTKRLIG